MMLKLIFLAICLIASSAFRPMKPMAKINARMQPLASSYWEGTAPPSSVLGVGEKIPSGVFGPLSLVAFALGTYCIHESNIFHQVTVTSINPAYVLGSTLVPISWGMHVAAWIQKQNGK